MRNHEPKHYERLKHLLLPKDEIRRRLTGEFATDVSDASGMLLLDVVKRKWSEELLRCLDIDPGILATVYESEEITGTLKPAVAKLLGLTSECKVVGGAGDCAAGAVGNGVVKQGVLSTSLGTSGVVFVHSDRPEYDQLRSTSHVLPCGSWQVAYDGCKLRRRCPSVVYLAGVPELAKRGKRSVQSPKWGSSNGSIGNGRPVLPTLSWPVNGRRTPIRMHVVASSA